MAVSSTVGRMRSSAGLLIAVATMVTVTCTLVALVPVYSTAIVEAGLRGTVADAGATDRAIDVTTRGAAADAAAVIESLDGDVLEPTADAFRSARFAETGAHRIVDPPVDVDPVTGTSIVTSLATFVGDDLLRAVTGDLDRLDGGGSAAPWPAALHVGAAELLGIGVGDAVQLEPTGAAPDRTIDLTIVALLEPVDAADARWFGQPLGRLGTSTTGSFTEVGPFFVTTEHFAELDGDAAFTGRYALDESSLESDDVDALIASVGGVDDTFATALAPRTARIETGLDGLLSATDTSVRSTGAVVAAILLQLAAVALYGLGVAASVLVASRRPERVLVHSRGISTGQVGRDAALEAGIIALPAAIVGPFLAVVAVGVVGSWGPLQASGLDLRGRVSPAAFALTLLAALGAIAIIVWPAVSAARSPTSEAADASRPPFLRRTGLDIVLFVVAVLGLWQLHRTGSVATSSSPGARASVDPVLVLAPTLGVAAASLLAVRLLAAGATLLERAGTRSRRLAPALAGWEAAREGSRRNRSSVLIVVAVAVATFALVHAVSWEQSQQDQAAAEVGADVVVAPDHRADAPLQPPTLPAAYRSIDGVDDVTPVDRRAVALTRQFGAVPIIAVDATRFDEFSRLRPDATAPSETIAALSSPPELEGIALPSEGGEVSATFTLEAFADDVETGERTTVDVDVDVAVVVVDEFGTVRQLGAEAVTSASGPSTVSFGRLEPSADERRPPRLVEIEVTTLLRFVDFDQDFDFDDDGTVDVDPFTIAGFDLDLAMTEFSVDGQPVDLAASTWDAIAPPSGPSVTWASEATVSSLDDPPRPGDGDPDGDHRATPVQRTLPLRDGADRPRCRSAHHRRDRDARPDRRARSPAR